MKPSKKVTGIIIIIFALTSAFIVSDKLKESEKNEENTIIEGEIESANPVKSIEEYMINKITEEKGETVDTKDTKPQTLTDFSLSNLFGNYLSLKSSSSVTQENIDQITKNASDQAKKLAQLPNRYSMIDLNTFPDYQKEKAKKYGDEFALITEKYFKQRFFIEETDNEKYVQAYSDIQLKYSEELSKIEVPRSISDDHLDYINNLSKVSIALVTLASENNDPILNKLILNQYNEIRLMQPQIMISISDYFINNDIIFSDEDPGAMWNNI